MANHKHRILRTNKQRIAWTNTSRLTDDEVIEALKLTAKYANLDRTVVHVKSMGERRRSYGRAYYGIPLEANLTGLEAREWRYLIIVTDHGQNRLTRSIVDTFGHEARHIEQHRSGRLRREKANRNCEAQCRAFGAWLADKWVAK